MTTQQILSGTIVPVKTNVKNKLHFFVAIDVVRGRYAHKHLFTTRAKAMKLINKLTKLKKQGELEINMKHWRFNKMLPGTKKASEKQVNYAMKLKGSRSKAVRAELSELTRQEIDELIKELLG